MKVTRMLCALTAVVIAVIMAGTFFGLAFRANEYNSQNPDSDYPIYDECKVDPQVDLYNRELFRQNGGEDVTYLDLLGKYADKLAEEIDEQAEKAEDAINEDESEEEGEQSATDQAKD